MDCHYNLDRFKKLHVSLACGLHVTSVRSRAAYDESMRPEEGNKSHRQKELARATDMGVEPITSALGGPRATIAPTGLLMKRVIATNLRGIIEYMYYPSSRTR